MDELMQAIVDHPDDDAPRLVWADRVGGDRGELVVLQCAIAARDGSREDRIRMQARVRELLPRISDGGIWRRGFCESTTSEQEDVPEAFARHPLLRAIVLDWHVYIDHDETFEGVLEQLGRDLVRIPGGRLRELEIDASMEGATLRPRETGYGFGDALVAVLADALPSLDTLVALDGELTSACFPAVNRLGLRSLRGGMAEVALPPVERFGPWNSRVIGATLANVLAGATELVELDLKENNLGEADLFAIARTPFSRLEALGLDWATWTRDGAAAIAGMGLTGLGAYVWRQPAPPLDLLVTPTLRTLRLGHVTADDIAVLVRSQLEQLSVDTIDPPDLAILRAHIPLVNDD